MEKLTTYTLTDGTYDCDCNISTDEWKSILLNSAIADSDTLDYLCKFYAEDGHKATCGDMAKKYFRPYQSFSVVISTFGLRVQQYLKRFSIVGKDDRTVQWIIPMTGRYLKGGYFEWQLRKELVAAIEELNLNSQEFSKAWILPSNSNKFDIAGALEKFGFVDWKQKNNFHVGDIVYIYSTKPDQCIRYRFCVTDVDLTFEQSQSDIEFWNDQDEFYTGKEHNRYCRFVLNGELDQGILDLDKLVSKGLKGAPQSAMSVSGELKEYIENYFKPQMKRVTFVDEAESVVEFTEGSTSLVTRSSRQRNRNARQKCIELMGAVCSICGFDFEKHYGSIGKGFIHVHHKTPISEREGNYRIDISSDLVPVCPNCHAMLHIEVDGKCLSVEELAKIVKL